MSGLSGPALEKLSKQAESWYVQRRQMLIERLEEDYPYGAVKLDNLEQYSRYLEMLAPDYEALIYRLNEKYRGVPNSYQLVNRDLAAYLSHMLGLALGGENA